MPRDPPCRPGSALAQSWSQEREPRTEFLMRREPLHPWAKHLLLSGLLTKSLEPTRFQKCTKALGHSPLNLVVFITLECC